MTETKLIKLSKSCIDDADLESVCAVLKEEYLGMGSWVKNFENEIKSFLVTSNEVVCVNTGTAALHLALEAVTNLGDRKSVV